MRTVYHHWRVWNSLAVSVRSRAVQAVTAIEVLAITLVVSLMMLTLLPALARTKSPVAQTKCCDNLRQLMQGVAMFALDNNDSMPLPNWSSYGPGWLYKPASFGLPPGTSDPASASGTIWPFVKARDAYVCPLDANGPYYVMRNNRISTYVMNGAVSGYGGLSDSAYCLSQFKPEAFCLWEPKDGPFAYSDGSSYPSETETPGVNHPGGTPVGTFGGAATFPSVTEFKTEMAAPQASLVWCNPGKANGR